MPNRQQPQVLTPPEGKLLKESQSPPRTTSTTPTQGRAACTECSRRKQKCNREWPCNHCKKRKVADKCSFTHDAPAGAPKPTPSSLQDPKRKRDGEREAQDDEESVDDHVQYGGSGFEALGYSAAHLFAGLPAREERPSRSQQYKPYLRTAEACPQLARALKLLPPRPYTDLLIQNFLGHVNFHYYIIYPRDFLKEYRDWWRDRTDNKPLRLQWTCLLIMICACSMQFTEPDLEHMLEADLGQSVGRLSESYHNMARELYAVIPVGHNHMHSVQQLLHSCYWYKSEGRFVESWHVLAAAIQQAQELRIHQERLAGPTAEFEREMRRRLWSIMNTWDWQITTILGRSMIIDRNACDVQLPALNLEEYEPSPLLHIKYYSEVVNELAEAFGLVKYITTAGDIEQCHRILDDWVERLPEWYAWENPDTSKDDVRPCIPMHRHYLRVVGNSMALDPIRAYLTKNIVEGGLVEDIQMRDLGVDYCFKLMQALRDFFDFCFPRSAKFHMIGFGLFDTAAVLCSAVLHDKNHSLQRKHEVLRTIEEAITMLGKLSTVTPSAKTSYQLLLNIAARIKGEHSVGESIVPPPIKLEPEALAAPIPTISIPAIPPDLQAKGLSTQSNSLLGTSSMSQAQQLATPIASPWALPYNGEGRQVYQSSASYSPETGMANLMPSSVSPLPAPTIPYDMGSLGNVSMAPTNMLPAFDPTNPLSYGHMTAQTESDVDQTFGAMAPTWQYRPLNLDFVNPDG